MSLRRTHRLARLSLALALGAQIGVNARDASAFCRSTTVPVASNFQPQRDRCWTEGVPLFWKNTCIGYSMHRAASTKVAYDDAANALSLAFSKWTGASCPTDGTGTSRVSVDVRDLGPVDCGAVKYNATFGNQNVIVFRDDLWNKNDSSNTLALTTVTFDKDTGEIFDADMEINTFDHVVELRDPVPAGGYDFASIVTHEAGHFLGIAHSGDPNAVMYSQYRPGTTSLRYLTQDDISGICTVYRPDGTRAVLDMKQTGGSTCDPVPRHGFVSECAPPAESKFFLCTQIAPGNVTGAASRYAGFALAMLSAIRIVARRQSRSARTRHPRASR